MSAIIKLPQERHDQLKALSEKWNLSIADCIGKMINEQIAAGELPEGLPGVTVKKYRAGAKLVTPDLDLTFKRLEYLEAAGKAIRAMTRPAKGKSLVKPPEGLGVARRGTSVKITDTSTGKVTTLAPSIAEELADQMERVAKS